MMNTSSLFISANALTRRAALVSVTRSTVPRASLHVSRVIKRKSIVEEANEKAGKGAAKVIDSVEELASKAAEVKQEYNKKGIVGVAKAVGQEANLKAGQGIAKGIQGAESILEKSPIDAVKQVVEKAKSVVGLSAEKAEQVKDTAEKAKNTASEKLNEAKDTASEKLNEAKDTASEKLNEAKNHSKGTKEQIKDTAEKAKNTASEKLNEAKRRVSQ